jgi:hypothetical protein
MGREKKTNTVSPELTVFSFWTLVTVQAKLKSELQHVGLIILDLIYDYGLSCVNES